MKCEHALADSRTQACTHCGACREEVLYDLRKRLGPSLNYPTLSLAAARLPARPATDRSPPAP